MRPSRAVLGFARHVPAPVRGLLRLAANGYLPGGVRRHWLSEALINELYSPDQHWRLPLHSGGLRLHVPPRFLHHHVFQEYEPVTRRTFLRHLRRGMVVVDVGAHIGYYTVVAARRVGDAGRVHAVEPSPENLALLRDNLSLNGLTNVAIHAVAAGTQRRGRRFHLTESSDSSGFHSHPLTPTVRTTEVMETPLDELVDGRVHALKIDVEGSEIDVLRGSRRILADNPAIHLFVEWNPACMKSAGLEPAELPRYLRGCGFRRLVVLDDGERRVGSLADALARIDAGAAPDTWYANLWATR